MIRASTVPSEHGRHGQGVSSGTTDLDNGTPNGRSIEGPTEAIDLVLQEQALEHVRQSTVQKVQEILALQEQIYRSDGRPLLACAAAMAEAFACGGRLLAFGNGGNSTDAQDLASLFLNPRDAAHPLPAFGLTSDIAVLTVPSDGVGFDVVFARQIAAFGRSGDIAVGLSTSAISENLLRAFNEAHRRDMLTIGISGDRGGKMAELTTIDHLFIVPSSSVYRIQEAQRTIYHALWELTVAALSSEDSSNQERMSSADLAIKALSHGRQQIRRATRHANP